MGLHGNTRVEAPRKRGDLLGAKLSRMVNVGDQPKRLEAPEIGDPLGGKKLGREYGRAGAKANEDVGAGLANAGENSRELGLTRAQGIAAGNEDFANGGSSREIGGDGIELGVVDTAFRARGKVSPETIPAIAYTPTGREKQYPVSILVHEVGSYAIARLAEGIGALFGSDDGLRV